MVRVLLVFKSALLWHALFWYLNVRSFGPRSFGTRSFGTRSFSTRSFSARSFSTRSFVYAPVYAYQEKYVKTGRQIRNTRFDKSCDTDSLFFSVKDFHIAHTNVLSYLFGISIPYNRNTFAVRLPKERTFK